MAHIIDSVTRGFVTITEMLRDRGVDSSALEAISDKMLIEELTRPSTNNSATFNVTDTIKVVFCMGAKPAPDLRTFIGTDYDVELSGKKRPQVIIVTKEPLQAAAIKKVLTEFKHVQLQFFTLKELQFNISHHHLVPTHALVDEEIVPDLMIRYMVKSKGQFPNILKTDPMARYINAQPGDIVCITRPSPSAGEYVSYRHCV
jgi:DNA-directed RNA polymerase subunit H (RpoH/RPB5)